MTLIDRYVEAVKRYLPGKTRDDIGEELRSLLEDKKDETEEKKGAPLEEADIHHLLKEFGHPLKIASDYQRRRVLISEPVFPIYKQTLKYAILIMVTLYLCSFLIRVSWNLEWWPVQSIWNIFSDPINLSLDVFALITLAFLLLDGVLDRIDFFKNWNPAKLPNPRGGSGNIQLSATIFNLVVTAFILSFLITMKNEYVWDFFTLKIDDQAMSFLPWIMFLAGLAFLLGVVNLHRPYWTRLKLVLFAAVGLVFSLILIQIVMLENIINLLPPPSDAGQEIDRFSRASGWVNFEARLVIGIIALVCIWDSAIKLRRALKLNSDN
jgi:hypothetical protein